MQNHDLLGRTRDSVVSIGLLLPLLSRLDELTPNTVGRRSGGSVKRKADFDSPVPKKINRPDTNNKTPGKAGKVDGPAYVISRPPPYIHPGEDANAYSNDEQIEVYPSPSGRMLDRSSKR